MPAKSKQQFKLMPAKSKQQFKLMAAVANSPSLAKEKGIPQKVAKEFVKKTPSIKKLPRKLGK